MFGKFSGLVQLAVKVILSSIKCNIITDWFAEIEIGMISLTILKEA